MKKPKLKIESTAIFYSDGNIYTGMEWNTGHTDIFAEHDEISILDKGYQRGFITSRGDFVGRREAGDIAFKAGQTPQREMMLYSYNLK